MMFDVLKLGPEAAVQVAYKGGGDAALAVLSREVDFNCGNLTSLIGNLKGGRMRALFTTTPQRWQDIPDVPTVRELGYPQLEAIIGWSALYGPPGMTAEQIAFWREALAKVAADQQWIAGTERIGGMPSIMTPADTRRFVAGQFELYDRIGKQLGIEIQ
jgi:tripartite-type tricarboxylate transporter receptor subunit TctC